MSKPPFSTHDERERQAMIKFVVDELIAEDVESERMEQQQPYAAEVVASERAFRHVRWENVKQEARRGNVEPLRALVPADLAEFVGEPLRVRGQKRPVAPDPRQCFQSYVNAGRAADIERVRAIWRREYDGRWKRHADDGPSAEEIVDAYRAIYGLD
jgi:hypothetical protein